MNCAFCDTPMRVAFDNPGPLAAPGKVWRVRFCPECGRYQGALEAPGLDTIRAPDRRVDEYHWRHARTVREVGPAWQSVHHYRGPGRARNEEDMAAEQGTTFATPAATAAAIRQDVVERYKLAAQIALAILAFEQRIGRIKLKSLPTIEEVVLLLGALLETYQEPPKLAQSIAPGQTAEIR